jgi:hypothetical protein
MNDRVEVSKFVCRQNIERYERMLKTYLTDLERSFIERRLAEEKHALQIGERTASTAIGSEMRTFGPASGAAIFLWSFLEMFLSNLNLAEQVSLL